MALAEEHAKKARGYEAKLQEKIQERQQVFEEAFKEEIENYRQHGKTQSESTPSLCVCARGGISDPAEENFCFFLQ